MRSAATANRDMVPLRAALWRVLAPGAPNTDAAWQDALKPARGLTDGANSIWIKGSARGFYWRSKQVPNLWRASFAYYHSGSGAAEAAPEPANAVQPQPISVRIPEACRLTGIGRSKLYELIAAGDLEVVKIGAMTLVPYESLRCLEQTHAGAGISEQP